MATHNQVRRTETPGDPEPYVIDRYSGRKSNLGGDVFWAPVGGDETGGEFALIRTSSTQVEEPVTPMHSHENEQDVFMCLRGRLQVWADGESRMLYPGDFASVPPGTHHSYRPASPRTEVIGLIDTGGWEEFFFDGGQPHDGPPFMETTGIGGPSSDSDGVVSKAIGTVSGVIDTAKFARVAMKYGVNRSDKEFIEPDLTATDRTLPGAYEPYFLEAGYGPQHALGGTLATTICSDAETDGSFGIVSYEGPTGTGLPSHRHADAHKAIYVTEGEITVELDGQETTASTGQCINVPAGTSFSYTVTSNYAQHISFTSGDSAHKLPEVAGESWEEYHNPNPDRDLDHGRLEQAAKEIDVVFSQ